jgi:hypothetical protein
MTGAGSSIAVLLSQMIMAHVLWSRLTQRQHPPTQVKRPAEWAKRKLRADSRKHFFH